MKTLRTKIQLCLAGATAAAALSACSQQSYSVRLSASTLITELASEAVEFKTTFTGNHVWVVTRNPYRVHRIALDESKSYPVQTWNLPSVGGGGTRTAISEIGLLMARPTALYRVDEDVPEGTELQPIWQATGALAGARVCVTSFRHENQAYVGIAWNKPDRRVITRIPIDPSKPGKIDVSRAESRDLPAPAIWGYGCYTDQSRGILWSNYWGKTYIAGVNLRTLENATIESAPNHGLSNPTLGEASIDLTGAPLSYAISGDARGNVLAGRAYTYAHEAKHDLVYWATGGNLHVARGECFGSRTLDCAIGTNHLSTSMSSLGSIGPMGSLQDGRVIGITRGTGSKVFLLSAGNPENLAAGVDAELIKQLEGDAYMYNDFTGSTLYARETAAGIDLSSIKGFDPAKKTVSIVVSWQALGGGTEAWQGFTLQARCLVPGAQSQGTFETIGSVASSGEEIPVGVSSCGRAEATRLELRAIPHAKGPFSRVNGLTIKVRQQG